MLVRCTPCYHGYFNCMVKYSNMLRELNSAIYLNEQKPGNGDNKPLLRVLFVWFVIHVRCNINLKRQMGYRPPAVFAIIAVM